MGQPGFTAAFREPGQPKDAGQSFVAPVSQIGPATQAAIFENRQVKALNAPDRNTFAPSGRWI